MYLTKDKSTRDQQVKPPAWPASVVPTRTPPILPYFRSHAVRVGVSAGVTDKAYWPCEGECLPDTLLGELHVVVNGHSR